MTFTWRIGASLDPEEALTEVVRALEAGRAVANPLAAALVAPALRRCMNGKRAEDRDLLRAMGIVIPRGGRSKTLPARALQARQLRAAFEAMTCAPGATARERGACIEAHLRSTAPADAASSPALLDALAELRACGMAGLSARTIATKASRYAHIAI